MGLFDDVLNPKQETGSGGLFDDVLKPKKRSIGDIAGDIGVTALKGAVALPQAAVGIADIPTGGRIGKALEGIGYRPDETQKTLDTWYSDPQQEANRKVREAEGFVPTLKAAIENPSAIATTVGESIPQMLGGAGIARGVMKGAELVGKKVSPLIAGAIGEGAIGAGSAAESIREQSPDRLLTGKQSLAAAGSGAGTMAFGALGGKLAQRFDFGDIDKILAQGGPDAVGAGAAKQGFLKQVAGSGISEGVFEELPQSIQEQMWQNYANDKPLTEGVGNAAAMGLLAGTVMGGAAGGYNAFASQPGGVVPAEETPVSGLLGSPVSTGTPSDQVTQAEVERANAVAAAQDNADAIYKARADFEASQLPEVNPATGEAFTQDREQAIRQNTMRRDIEIRRTMEEAKAQLGTGAIGRAAAAGIDSGAIAPEQVLPQVETPIIEPDLGESNVGIQGRIPAEVAQAGDQGRGDIAQPGLPDAVVRPAGGRLDVARSLAPSGGTDMAAGTAAGGAGAVIARVGATPNATEPVTVRNGVVHLGGYPAQNFETGEDITVPENATFAQVRDALKTAGALSSKQRVYPGVIGSKAAEPMAKPAIKPKQKPIPSALATKNPQEYSEATKAELLKLLRKHGLSSNDARDITGETAFKANRQSGGAFRGKTSLDKDVIPALVANGYLTQQQVDEDPQGGMGAAMNLARDAFTGSKFVGTFEQQERMAELEKMAADSEAELQDAAEQAIFNEIIGSDLTQAEFDSLFSGVPVDEATDRRYADIIKEQENDAAKNAAVEAQAEKAGARGAAAGTQGRESKDGTQQSQADRRGDLTRRKKIASMTPEEMRRELLVDAMTGLGNRRAYDESTKLATQVSIDADGLKWINDNLGHESGDRLLETIGKVIAEETTNGFHISGDEYVIQTHTKEEADAIMARVVERLNEVTIESTTTDGKVATMRGIGISYGINGDLNNAEKALREHKAQREREGLRGGRGAVHPNAVIGKEGRQDQQDNDTAEEEKPALELTGQTPAQVEAAADKKAADAKTDAAAEAKDKADRERAGFALTGSDRAADVAAGQGDLLQGKETTLSKQEAKQPAQDKSPITDIGEKIGGARKDVWASYKDKLDDANEVDIKAEPLSKSWPAPDYEAMLEDGAEPWAVAFMHAARDEIPTKPSATWKLSRWVEQVKTLREFAAGLADGSMSVEKTRLEIAKTQALSDIASRVELYMAVGHSKSLRGVRMTSHSYSLYKGTEYSPPKVMWAVEQKAKATAFSNWPRELAIGDTKEEALTKFKEQFAALDIDKPASKETKFEIYSTRGEKGYRIGKKMGRNPILLTEGFATVKEAREYMREHQDELVKKLEDAKKIPSVRRDINEPRVGEDMRDGRDVTPQMFMDEFGFRGVEFGNWVEQKKRQKDLNEAYDALMDMAAIIGVKPKALSLNGELELAFGARGTGGVDPAKAHYEAGFVVINLTKKEGAGSLGHEWWHALDNYFSRLRGKKADFTTEALDVSLARRGSEFIANTEIRKEMIEAFGGVMRAIHSTALRARSAKLDAKRNKEYWTTGLEMSARAYESYLISKLQDQDASNDYLANIVDEKTWAAAEKIGFELGESYPYPTAGEVPAIRAAFDHFFRTVETKETDTGTAMFSRFYSPLARAFEQAKQESMPAGMWKGWLNANAAKLGLKKDEITWSGIEEFLELQGKAKVSKADIADYLGESGVMVEDVVLGKVGITEEESARMMELMHAEARSEDQQAELDALLEKNKGMEPKFSQYAPPGGIPGTYRETLVTLPKNSPKRESLLAEKAVIGRRLQAGGGLVRRIADQNPDYFKDVERYEKINEQLRENYKEQFTSGHFDQKNILVHIRTDEVEEADGKRYLRVIEVQSDWHQSRTQGKEVPDAPFTDTRAWVALGIKRAIIQSAESGVDGVVFATGQQNADLYDLSKQVDSVEIRRAEKGDTYYVAAKRDGMNVVERDNVQGLDGVADLVGKEIAKKAEGIKPGGKSVYDGLDLKVGGRGMMEFYNTIVPSVANDVLKKLGGGKVQQIAFDLPVSDGETRQFGFQLTDAMREHVAQGLPLFARRLHGDRPTVSDYIIPETPEFEGNLSGDLAYTPQSAEAKGIRQLPIRLTVGVSREAHRGFGINKLKAEADRNLGREPPNATDDRAENFARQVANVARDFDQIYTEGGKVILRSSRMKQALVVEARSDNGEWFYSVVSLRPAENVVWGLPDWTGRSQGQSDRLRKSSAPEPSPDQDSPQSDRQFRERQSSKFQFTQDGPDRQQPTVTVKKRRAFTMNDDAMFRGLTEAESVKRVVRVQSIVNGIKAKWKNAPEVVVVANMQDPNVPKRVRDQDAQMKSRGATGEPRGFITNGTVYIVAGQNGSVESVVETLAHETLGHAGLRGMFGDSLNGVLDQIVAVRRKDITDKAVEYGLHSAKKGASKAEVFASMTQTQKRQAAEEVLANMAQTQPQIGFVKRAIAAIRQWLRANGFNLKVSDNDIINQFILPARAFIENGAKPLDYAQQEAFSRIDQTETEAFKRWFKDSKVVDADGKPLVVYHGTTENITAFDTARGAGGESRLGPGAYFTPNRERAVGYGENVVSAYLALKKPYITGTAKGPDYNHIGPKRSAELKTQGYDGIILLNDREVPIEYVAFEPAQIKSAIGNTGDFDPANPDIRFSRSSGEPVWSSLPESRMDTFLYEVQDKIIDTKRVIESIKAKINDVADEFNTYAKEALYHGRADKITKDFLTDELTPLVDAMAKHGVTQIQLNEYLHARHAIERNRVMRERNPDRSDNTDLSGMSDDAANEILKKAPLKMVVLAKQVDAIVVKSRQMLVDYGLETQETVDAWNKMYKHYVPLKREGFDDTRGTGQGFSVRGSSTKEAVGSHRAVDNIFANIAMQRERNITRGEKNRVALSLYGLAKTNPNADFWKLDKPAQITQINPETGLPEVVPGDMADYKVPRVKVLQHDIYQWAATKGGDQLGAFKTKGDALAYLDNEGIAGGVVGKLAKPYIESKVVERVDPNYKGRDNIVTVRIKGRDHAVIFNESDPRALRMAESLKNLDMDHLGEVIGSIGRVTRYIASVNTQYNPVFGVTNMLRDVQTAMLNLQSTPLKGKQRDVMKEAMGALKGIYQDARAVRQGKHPNSEYAKDWEEFQRTGGQTGYRDMFRTSKDRAAAIEHMLDPAWWQKTYAGKVLTLNGVLAKPEQMLFDTVGKHLFRWLEDYNTAMENSMRLAAYRVGKRNGMSQEAAAFLAKSLTVNFNKKGRVATQAGALYAFFNASAQGTARIAETLRYGAKPGEMLGKTGKAIVTGGIALGAMQALLLLAAGFDEDEPPEFVRERNLIIPAPGTDKGYITIPMPLGFHVLPNIGRVLVESSVYGKPLDRTADLMLTLFEAFNPIGTGASLAQTISPTVADPIVGLAENKDWTGKRIFREDFSQLNPTPGFTRTKDNASILAKGLAYGINAITGGSDYTPGKFSPTPDQIDYLIGQATGGVGREVTKAITATGAVVSGEELPMYKVPLAGRIIGSAGGTSGVRDKFYDNLRILNLHEAEIQGRRDKREPVFEYIAEHPEARLAKYAGSVESRIREKKRLVKQAKEAGRDTRLIDAQIVNMMQQLNQRVEEART
jgi:diguanylate cyclase (GGDEF)-like protein